MRTGVLGSGCGPSNGRAARGVPGENIGGLVSMWNAANWGEGLSGAFTQLVLGQEFEHRFAMFINPLPGGRMLQGDGGSCGRGAHWNFRADGQGDSGWF